MTALWGEWLALLGFEPARHAFKSFSRRQHNYQLRGYPTGAKIVSSQVVGQLGRVVSVVMEPMAPYRRQNASARPSVRGAVGWTKRRRTKRRGRCHETR